MLLARFCVKNIKFIIAISFIIAASIVVAQTSSNYYLPKTTYSDTTTSYSNYTERSNQLLQRLGPPSQIKIKDYINAQVTLLNSQIRSRAEDRVFRMSAPLTTEQTKSIIEMGFLPASEFTPPAVKSREDRTKEYLSKSNPPVVDEHKTFVNDTTRKQPLNLVDPSSIKIKFIRKTNNSTTSSDASSTNNITTQDPTTTNPSGINWGY